MHGRGTGLVPRKQRMIGSELHHVRHSHGCSMLSTAAAMQVLYSYPLDSSVEISHWRSLCFPHGVQPSLLERTPSMSSLNDLLYSQNYLSSDASSFISFTKVLSYPFHIVSIPATVPGTYMISSHENLSFTVSVPKSQPTGYLLTDSRVCACPCYLCSS